jgi:hypothetical protein
MGVRHKLIGLGLTASFAAAVPSAASADVVVNEVNSCEGGDFVELVNTGPEPADVSGWLLTDDPLDRDPLRADHRMLFADGTLVPAGGSLLLVEGDGPNEFPFGIGCGGDRVRLADETGTSLVDEAVTPGLEIEGAPSWGRYPNGSGAFELTAQTPGAPNQPFEGGEPGGDQAAWLFDPETVVEIDLDLPQGSIDALNEVPDEYVEGTFSLGTTGGTYGPLTVGVRLKGGVGSFRPLTGKSAFKVKFAEFVPGQRFLGLKNLTLNNMVQDASNVRELLSYEAFRAMGIAAPRTGYAFVRVNDDPYGLYLNVETMDDVALPRWFETTGHLYEGEYGSDVTPGEAGLFDVDEGPEDDRSDLEALIQAVAAPGDFSENVEPLLDLEQATRMWAVERYIGHLDSYSGTSASAGTPNNFYLHSDGSGRFSMVPWGTDLTWSAQLSFTRGRGVLFMRCMDDPDCFARYREAVEEARVVIASLDLDGLAADTAERLFPWQELDPRRQYTLDGIAYTVALTRAFIGRRPAEAAAWLASLEPRGGVKGVQGPGTKLTRRPKKRGLDRTVRFAFTSTLEGGGFQCRLNRRGWAPCDSPLDLTVAPRRHTFRVRAVSPAGLTDPSPAVFRFRVDRPGRGG